MTDSCLRLDNSKRLSYDYQRKNESTCDEEESANVKDILENRHQGERSVYPHR